MRPALFAPFEKPAIVRAVGCNARFDIGHDDADTSIGSEHAMNLMQQLQRFVRIVCMFEDVREVDAIGTALGKRQPPSEVDGELRRP